MNDERIDETDPEEEYPARAVWYVDYTPFEDGPEEPADNWLDWFFPLVDCE